MKNLFILILFSSLLVSPSFANNGTAMMGGFFGAAGVMGASVYGSRANELESWKRNGTESSSKLDYQCGFFLDSRLYGNNTFNYFYIMMQKDTEVNYEIDFTNIEINFNNGIERLAPLQSISKESNTISSKFVYLFIPFPSKNDFIGSEKIDISLNLKESSGSKTCKISRTFSRNKDKKIDQISVESKSTGSFSLSYGAIIDKSDSLSSSTSNDSFIDLSFNGYANLNHGFGFSLFVLPLGDGDSTMFSSITGSASVVPDPHLFGTTFGYSYRHDISEKWNFVYDLQIGYSAMKIDNPDIDNQKTDGTFVAYHKLSVGRSVYQVLEGFYRKDVFVGISVNHLWLASGMLAPVNIKGSVIGTLGFVRWEY